MSELPLCTVGQDTPPPVPDRVSWATHPLLQDSFTATMSKGDIAGVDARSVPVLTLMPAAHGSTTHPQDPDPEEILRLRLARCDLPAMPLTFACKVMCTKGWEDWIRHMIHIPSHKQVLKDAKILRTVTSTVHYNMISRDLDGLTTLIARWCRSTHTFVAAWGEFTPTLEDVQALLHLPILGDRDIGSCTLSHDDQVVVQALKDSLVVSRSTRGARRANYSQWINYFYKGEGTESNHVLPAFIAFWFCRYVFPGPPLDGVSERVFPYAVAIAKGRSYSLAPAYLGTLYHRLDDILEQSVRSKGRYLSHSFLDTHFLQMFMFERFEEYSPILPKRASRSGIMMRSACWERCPKKSPFRACLDRSSCFRFRPYTEVPSWVHAHPPIRNEEEVVDLTTRDKWSLDASTAFLTYLPRTIVGLVEHPKHSANMTLESVLYLPHRVARQFGFDQDALAPSPLLEVASKACALFTTKHFGKLHSRLTSLTIPSSSRVGVNLLEWVDRWRVCQGCFRQFIFSPRIEVPTVTIFKFDPKLHAPPRIDTKSDGRMSVDSEKDDDKPKSSKRTGKSVANTARYLYDSGDDSDVGGSRDRTQPFNKNGKSAARTVRCPSDGECGSDGEGYEPLPQEYKSAGGSGLRHSLQRCVEAKFPEQARDESPPNQHVRKGKAFVVQDPDFDLEAEEDDNEFVDEAIHSSHSPPPPCNKKQRPPTPPPRKVGPIRIPFNGPPTFGMTRSHNHRSQGFVEPASTSRPLDVPQDDIADLGIDMSQDVAATHVADLSETWEDQPRTHQYSGRSYWSQDEQGNVCRTRGGRSGRGKGRMQLPSSGEQTWSSVTGAVGPEPYEDCSFSPDDFLGPLSPYPDSPASDPIAPEGHSIWRGIVVEDDSVDYLELIHKRHGDIFQALQTLSGAHRTIAAEDVVRIARILDQYTLETLPRKVRRNLITLMRGCQHMQVKVGWIKATFKLVRTADALPKLKERLTQLAGEEVQTRARLAQIQEEWGKVNETVQEYECAVAEAGPLNLRRGLF